MPKYQPKSFWRRPEGVTGLVFLSLFFLGGGALLLTLLPSLAFLFESTLSLLVMVGVLAVVAFLFIDPKMRGLISYGFKAAMRWITGLFIKTNPIGVLKSYVADLQLNLRQMNRQINKLRGQMHQLQEQMFNNQRAIKTNLKLAEKARQSNSQSTLVLKTRKAARLQASNEKLDALYRKMDNLYRVLVRMYENSEVLAEDVKDEVKLKEQELQAIQASNTAMRSAMDVLKGDDDRKARFETALAAIADDVGNKVGEMERFMSMSANFMDSIDLQNGVFEEEGLAMLEKWQQDSRSKLLGGESADILEQARQADEKLDLKQPEKQPDRPAPGNQYDSFFE